MENQKDLTKRVILDAKAIYAITALQDAKQKGKAEGEECTEIPAEPVVVPLGEPELVGTIEFSVTDEIRCPEPPHKFSFDVEIYAQRVMEIGGVLKLCEEPTFDIRGQVKTIVTLKVTNERCE